MNNLYTNKKIILKRLFLILSAFFAVLSAKGQSEDGIKLDVPRLVPLSPTATAMVKYQSYPVDHCTGVPNITIPLYDIVAGEVTIPVTLSYHASGLKPKEGSGYAGAGWTLNLEPSIARQVIGVADNDYYGWFDRYFSQNTVPGDERDRLIYYGEMVDNKRDTRPDKFTYKLPGGGGSGYFSDRSSPLITVPHNSDVVRYVESDMNITDGNGVKYLFNGVHETMNDIITRWMCTSICSARYPHPTLVSFQYQTLQNQWEPSAYYNLNDRLVFDERDKDGSPKLYLMEQKSGGNNYYQITAGRSSGSSSLPNANKESVSSYVANMSYPSGSYCAEGRMSTTRLAQVNFMGNRLSVSYKAVGEVPNNTSVLDKMQVTDENGELVRTINFYVTPYNGKTSLTKLDSVRISAPGVESQTYSFRYVGVNSVPSIYTKAVDHWGFMNGSEASANGSKLTVPNFSKRIPLPDTNNTGRKDTVLFENAVGIDREASGNIVGILDRITDPQGIETSFSYEGNYGAFRDNSQQPEYRDYLYPVGGLRVKSIETYDPKTRKRLCKNYRYGLTVINNEKYESVWGGGAIKHIVTERDYCSTVTQVMDDGQSLWNEYLTVYHSMPVSNITFRNGSPVMYNIVSEEILGGGISQKTVYYYDVDAHAFEDVLHWESGENTFASVREFMLNQPESVLNRLGRMLPGHPYEPSDDFVTGYFETNQRNGALMGIDRFDGQELVSSTRYEYIKVIAGPYNIPVDLPVRKLIVDVDLYMKKPNSLLGKPVFVADNDNTHSATNMRTTYYLDCETYWALDKETTQYYCKVNGRQRVMSTEKQYAYDDRHLSNPGSSLKPRRVDFTNSDGVQFSDHYTYLDGYPAILSLHKHVEDEQCTEKRILFKSGTCLPVRVQFKTDRMADFRDEVVYQSYDSNSNVCEIMAKDDTPVLFIWGYRNRYPIAKIENATRQQVSVALGYDGDIEDVFGDWASLAVPTEEIWDKINSLRERLPGNTRVTTYEYVPLQGVVSITDPNNVITKFEYDNYSRLTDSYYLDADARKVMLQQYIYHFGK